MSIVNSFDQAAPAARTGKAVKVEVGLAYKTISDIINGNQIIVQPINADGTVSGDTVLVYVLPKN